MMTTLTIPKNMFQNDDLVVMSRKYYETIMANLVPTSHLKGRAARKLDERVAQAIKEHRAGKSRQVSSLRVVC